MTDETTYHYKVLLGTLLHAATEQRIIDIDDTLELHPPDYRTHPTPFWRLNVTVRFPEADRSDWLYIDGVVGTGPLDLLDRAVGEILEELEGR